MGSSSSSLFSFPSPSNPKKKKRVKLLFLDVDGVLNSMDRCGGDGDGLDEDKLRLLKQIIDATSAEIVISSSWRTVPCEMAELSSALRRNGMEHIGCTPKMLIRTEEIAAFIRQFKARNPDVRVTNWIAIDDMALEKWNEKMMRGHFVRTSLRCGMTKEDAVKAIQLLNKHNSK